MSRIREKFVQKREPSMPAVVEARTMICDIPLDVSRGESRGVWLQRASKLLGLTPAKGKRIYYGEVKRIDADTFNRMKTLNQRISSAKAAENRHQEEAHEIRKSLGATRGRIALDGGPSQRLRDEMAEERGVVSRPTDE